MKTIIKLAIVLILVNAGVRAGLVAKSYYELKDAAQQEALWGVRFSPQQLGGRVADKAAELGVPVEPENVDVSRKEDLTFISVGYTQPVELFPRFVYPVELSFAVQARSMTGLK